MKKYLIILLCLISSFTYSQTVRVLTGLDPNGRPGFIYRDTTYTLANSVNKYFTGYGTWGNFLDTARLALSASGNIAYNNGTGAISFTGVLPIANGGTNNGSLSVTNGNLIYSDGTKLVGLGVGTAAQHLVGGTIPQWKDTAVSGGGSSAISALTVATATNTINNAAYPQEWQWNTLDSLAALTLSSTSTVSSGVNQFPRMLRIASSGVHGTASRTKYLQHNSITNTGTASTNIAGYWSASGGTNNYAGIFENGQVLMGAATTVSATRLLVKATSGAAVPVFQIDQSNVANYGMGISVDNASSGYTRIFGNANGSYSTGIILERNGGVGIGGNPLHLFSVIGGSMDIPQNQIIALRGNTGDQYYIGYNTASEQLRLSTLEQNGDGANRWIAFGGQTTGGVYTPLMKLRTSGLANNSTGGNVTIGYGATGDTSAILDIISTKKGFIPPRMTSVQRDSMLSRIVSYGSWVGGSGYTNGTYTNIAFTGGSGTGATFTATVVGGVVSSSITIVNGGTAYVVGDVLGTSSIPGGSGFSVTITAITGTSMTGVTIFCTNCTATDTSTGVMQTLVGTTWKNYW